MEHKPPEDQEKQQHQQQSAATLATEIQNFGPILWNALMTHCHKTTEGDNTNSLHPFDIAQDLLRVEVHPRDLVEPLCQSLQHAAFEATANGASSFAHKYDENDAYDGPIELTKSNTKCTHKLVVILVSTTKTETRPEKRSKTSPITKAEIQGTTTGTIVYWGLHHRPSDNSLMDFPLNQMATRELQVVPCNCATGEETIPDDKTPPNLTTIPLSRAYYKLQQVYEEYLAPHKDAWVSSSTKTWRRILDENIRTSNTPVLNSSHHKRACTHNFI